jgi:hypothetical protein
VGWFLDLCVTGLTILGNMVMNEQNGRGVYFGFGVTDDGGYLVIPMQKFSRSLVYSNC